MRRHFRISPYLITCVPADNGSHLVASYTELGTAVFINVLKRSHVTVTPTRDYIPTCRNDRVPYA